MNDGPANLDRTAFEIQRLLTRSPTICPICLSVTESVKRHIDHLFYERVTDIATRAAIRRAQGFCRYHARLVSVQADALGTALIMRDVVINELRAIDGGDFTKLTKSAHRLTRFFDGNESVKREPCPICEVETGIEAQTVDSLLAGLTDPDLIAVFRQSAGFCLPHFHLAHGRCRDVGVWPLVLDTQRRALERISLELESLTRKSDYRHSSEAVGPEADSWRRALDLTSGWLDNRPK